MQPFTFSRRAWPLMLSLVLGLAACRRDRFADGIGRPEQQLIDAPVLSGARIVEVVPTGTPSVTITKPAGLDLTGYVLVSTNATTVPVPASLGSTTVTVPVGTLFEASATVANPVQSGEVALKDTAGTVQSYLAWGSDPAGQGSTLFVGALQSGAATTGSVVTVPFPRPDASAIVRNDELTGCFVGGTPCPAPAPTLALREVGPGSSPLVASFIEIENTAATDLDITGVRVCHDGACVPMPASVLAAGATLVACVGPVDSTRVCPASGLTLEGSTAIDGDTEMFLAAPGTITDTTTLLDYMRTSGGPSTIAAGALWPGDPAPVGTYVPGESLSRNPGALLPPVWNPARATPGAPNPVIDRTTNWQTCSEPAAAAAPPPTDPADGVIVTLLSRVDGTVTLTNTGDAVSNPATSLLLTVDDVEVALTGAPAEGLATNASLTVPAQVGDAGKLELRLRSGNVLLQFAQWGNPAAGVSAAVTASLWPREDCVLPRLAADESLVARDRALLRGSSGYAVE